MPTAELLEQIREAWSASGNNELIINAAEEGGTRNDGRRARTSSRDQTGREAAEAVNGSRRRNRRTADEFERNSCSWIRQQADAVPRIPDEAADRRRCRVWPRRQPRQLPRMPQPL